MAVPVGFVTLQEAADVVGRSLIGSRWRPLVNEHDCAAHVAAWRLCIDFRVNVCPLSDPDVERVITAIAERCESGRIGTTYEEARGLLDLPCDAWHRPHWRSYFETGEVILDLPLVDEKSRAVTDGRTARCKCSIFIRRADLDQFAPATSAEVCLRPASKEELRAEIRAIYRDSVPPPNIKQLPKLVRPRLNGRGLDASENNIATIGSEPEFQGRRRAPGKTIASERRQ